MGSSADWAEKDAAEPPTSAEPARPPERGSQEEDSYSLALRPEEAAGADDGADRADYFHVRRRTEHALGVDLSDVRVHADAESAEAAEAVAARAFTIRQDVHFGAGRFRPGTADGDRLIAHELVHAVQQRDAPAADELDVSVSRDPSEREAVGLAGAVTAGTTAHVTQRVAPQIARDEDDTLELEPEKWDKAFVGHRTAVGHSYSEYKKGIDMAKKAGVGR